MPFEPIQQESLSHGVIKQVEELILRGILRPGERLPPERELSERMNVSRPSLREALGNLQERGLLVSKAGAGVFVADVLGSAFAPALVKLFSTHEQAVFDYISFRRDMEGLAAERAARLASDTDLKVINTIFEKMEAAHQKRNPATEASLDADFHLSIIEASHNIIMLHMMRSMYELLREGVFYNRVTGSLDVQFCRLKKCILMVLASRHALLEPSNHSPSTRGWAIDIESMRWAQFILHQVISWTPAAVFLSIPFVL